MLLKNLIVKGLTDITVVGLAEAQVVIYLISDRQLIITIILQVSTNYLLHRDKKMLKVVLEV